MNEHLPPDDPHTDESPKERIDRELGELMQGLRVATTGIQVLFAFLLTVPFSTGFQSVPEGERWLLYLALGAAAVASACFITPAAQHRVLFRAGAGAKGLLVRRSNLYGLAGTVALMVALGSVTLFIFRLLIADWIAAGFVAALVAFICWAWFAQPLLTRVKAERTTSETPAPADDRETDKRSALA
ncbi:DUF6328 family protein [Nonomuraea sp. NPDC050310]|uniref:DUF6328 family protein n=1 Tax=unclassified Nonomuraea TaxID=2593643 RepID=UPI0033E4F1AD